MSTTVNPTLLSSNGIITREELKRVPTPAGTHTHKPIPHIEVLEQLIDTLNNRKLHAVREQHAVTSDGNKYFGIIELADTFDDCRYALGIRNSHDKTFALGITIGYKVLVCDNLAFQGDYTPVLKKHSKNFNLQDALSIGVDNIQRNFAPLAKSVNDWKNTTVSDDDVRLDLYRAFVEGKADLPQHLLRATHEAYFNPPHQEFLQANKWSLQNAYTEAAKRLDPIPRQKAAAEIGRYFTYHHQSGLHLAPRRPELITIPTRNYNSTNND